MGSESGPKPEDKIKDHAEKADKELDKAVNGKSNSDKIKETYAAVSKSLKPFLDEAEKNKDKSKVDKLITKALDITVRACEEQGIKLNDKQKEAIKGLFEGATSTGKTEVGNEPEKTESVKPKVEQKADKNPEIKDAEQNLKEKVQKEKNTIIPRDIKGNPSSDPRFSFDANQIPTSLVVKTLGQTITGDTPEGRTKIATQNIINSAGEAQVRANILEQTGKLPEEISDKRSLLDARANAETDLMSWQPDKDVVEKYLIKDKNLQK